MHSSLTFWLRVFCWLSAVTFLIGTSVGASNLSPLRGLQQLLLVASHGIQLRCQQLWVFTLSHIQHNFLQCSHTGKHYATFSKCVTHYDTWITVARKLRLQLLSHFLQSSLYFFLPRSSRKNAHSLLRYFGIRGIANTSFLLPNCRFAPETQKRPKPFPAVCFRGDFGRFLSI